MLEHRLAITSVVATFLLLLIGATVNITGSSLACPEPTLVCHGQLFPELVGGVLYEHGHRLVAMSVGFLQILLTIALWRRRPSLRKLAVLGLVMVCFQGALGAITVAFKLPTAVSVSHLLLAMLYWASTICAAWLTRPKSAFPIQTSGARLQRRWLTVALVSVYAQIALGALVRHTGAALACIDLPLCAGRVFPFGDALVLQVHAAHRIGGVLVACIVVLASLGLFRATSPGETLRRWLLVPPFLVALQITLGVFTILTFRQEIVSTAHFGVATVLWGVMVYLWLGAHSSVCASASHNASRHT